MKPVMRPHTTGTVSRSSLFLFSSHGLKTTTMYAIVPLVGLSVCNALLLCVCVCGWKRLQDVDLVGNLLTCVFARVI